MSETLKTVLLSVIATSCFMTYIYIGAISVDINIIKNILMEQTK